MGDDLAERFQDEKLAEYWRVDDSPESFRRLMEHLERKTNFKPFFEEAASRLGPADDASRELVVADIGAGVGWTSACLALRSDVARVYAVEPSENRLRCAAAIAGHLKVSKKVLTIAGSFAEPKVPEPADWVLLCGSLHHCYDEQVPGLLDNIRKLLKKDGSVLIANEHYVGALFSLKRFAGWSKRRLRGEECYWGALGSALRTPHPFDGEHWRTRAELERLFERSGFEARFHLHEGDLCKDKPTWLSRLGWQYYHAVLRPR